MSGENHQPNVFQLKQPIAVSEPTHWWMQWQKKKELQVWPCGLMALTVCVLLY